MSVPFVGGRDPTRARPRRRSASGALTCPDEVRGGPVASAAKRRFRGPKPVPDRGLGPQNVRERLSTVVVTGRRLDVDMNVGIDGSVFRLDRAYPDLRIFPKATDSASTRSEVSSRTTATGRTSSREQSGCRCASPGGSCVAHHCAIARRDTRDRREDGAFAQVPQFLWALMCVRRRLRPTERQRVRRWAARR